jgi:hypothetical protein
MALQQKNRLYLLSLLWAVFIVISIVLFQELLLGETERVRRFILKGEKCAEAKDIFSCARMVSEGYRDKYGNGKDSLVYAAKEACAYYKDVLIQIEDMNIALNDSKTAAEVRITALVVCKAQNGAPERIWEADKGEFRVSLVKEGRQWKLSEIEFFGPVTIMGQNIS